MKNTQKKIVVGMPEKVIVPHGYSTRNRGFGVLLIITGFMLVPFATWVGFHGPVFFTIDF